MKKAGFIFMLAIWHIAVSHAQYTNGEVIQQSANVDNYPVPDAFQQVGADLFRGNLQVSIPIYEYNVKKLRIPVSLNYSIQRKDYNETYHPGWTGWGWRLSAGGSINRRIRGFPDEDAKDASGRYLWPNGSNRSFDKQEDEFSFNFCGYSGTFLLHNGRWMINSDANIWLTCLFEGSGYTQPKKLAGFILMTPDGVSYYFGKSPGTYNDHAIEYGGSVKSGGSYGAITWNLSRIVSAEGDCIELDYERGPSTCNIVYEKGYVNAKYQDSYTYEVRTTIYMEFPDPGDTITYGRASDAFVTTTSYLKSISGGQVTVHFNRSASVEKNYPAADFRITKYKGFTSPGNFQWDKLDEIVFEDVVANRKFKKYRLNYTSDASQPLKLESVCEQGIQTDNTIVSKPPYLFEYDSAEAMKGALKKMTYPTGGFSVFEYENHAYMEMIGYPEMFPIKTFDYSKDVGYRIRRVLSYSGINETPFITEYSYADGQYESAKLSRRKQLSFYVTFRYGYEYVDVEKVSNMDMSTHNGEQKRNVNGTVTVYTNKGVLSFDPNLYGYTYVTETKWQGSQFKESTRYTFINYGGNDKSWNPEQISNIPGFFNFEGNEWYQAGKLLKKEQLAGSISKEQTIYDYYDPGCPVNYWHKETRTAVPISKTESYLIIDSVNLAFRKYPPKRIIQRVPYDSVKDDSLFVTTFSRDYETGNVICEERKDIYGNVYKTEYRFDSYLNIEHSACRTFDLPYEIVQWKNNRVIAAEVFQDTLMLGWGQMYYCRKPVRKYVLRIKTPITDYQPASYYARTMDSRCKLAAAYDYYPETFNLRCYWETGQEPVVFYWDTYNRLLAKIAGAGFDEVERACSRRSPRLRMEPARNTDPRLFDDLNKLRADLPDALITSYTYNVHGITSETDPTGRGQYIEYDVFGQPVKILDDEGNIRKIIQYDYQLTP